MRNSPLIVKICVGWLVLITALCVLAPVIAPEGPTAGELADRLKPPAWQEGGSSEFPLGTDQLGRDMVGRLLYSGRVSLLVGFSSVVLAGLIGITIGLLSGYFGGWFDTVMMRLVDIQLTLPFLALAILVTAMIGTGLVNVVLLLGIAGWILYARIVRAAVLTLRELEYVEASEVVGSSTWSILTRTILPAVMPSALVIGTLAVSQMIIIEASLSFLGMGLPPATPSWGTMLAGAQEYMTLAWWLAAFPGIAITLTVMATNVIGDWARDRFDPRLASLQQATRVD